MYHLMDDSLSLIIKFKPEYFNTIFTVIVLLNINLPLRVLIVWEENLFHDLTPAVAIAAMQVLRNYFLCDVFVKGKQ